MKMLLSVLLVIGMAASVFAAVNLDEKPSCQIPCDKSSCCDDPSRCEKCPSCDDPSCCKKGSDCCKDPSCCKKGSDCCKDPSCCKKGSGCNATCQGKKSGVIFSWMTDYVVDSGEVFTRLALTDKQKVDLKNLMKNKNKEVVNCAGGVFKACGECPIDALRTQKYKGNDAACLCVSSEVVMMIDKPLHENIKSILDEKQYKKYTTAVSLLNDYSKQARGLMKSGEKGKDKLAKLFALIRPKLDKVLPFLSKETAKKITQKS